MVEISNQKLKIKDYYLKIRARHKKPLNLFIYTLGRGPFFEIRYLLIDKSNFLRSLK